MYKTKRAEDPDATSGKKAKFIPKEKVEKRKREEQEEAEKRAALADFANYFDGEGPQEFVHAGTLYPPHHHHQKGGKGFGPPGPFPFQHHHHYQPAPQPPPIGRGPTLPTELASKKEKKEPKKSIDNLLEELKAKQKLRQLGQEIVAETTDKSKAMATGVDLTTVLVVSGLPVKATEEDLLTEFGRFGSITSIKLVTIDDMGIRQGRGLICFMERSAAEEAKETCQGKDLLGSQMKVAWGRPHVRPEVPMFVQDEDTKTCELNKRLPIIRVSGEFLDDKLINALAGQVAKEGVVFEEFIKAREKDNPHFQWLVDPYQATGTPEGSLEANPKLAFYKWRVYSLTQGDTMGRWRTCPFQMFLNSVIWVPPIQSERSRKQAREQEQRNPEREKKRVTFDAEPKEKRVSFAPETVEAGSSMLGPGLTEEEQEEFFEILRNMNTTRESIRFAMVFMMDHALCAAELVEILTEALTLNETPMMIKVARLFLVNDVLHNSSLTKVRGAAQFRRHLEKQLPAIFASFSALWASQPSSHATKLAELVNTVLTVWESWSVFPQQYLNHLRSIFTAKR